MQSSYLKKIRGSLFFTSDIRRRHRVLKQSGPANGVKSAKASALGISFPKLFLPAVLLALTACSSVWTHKHKSGAESALDERACAQNAQETVLIRLGTPRNQYGAPLGPSASNLNRGESPMELHKRSQTTTAYNTYFERCMRTKGYSKD